MPKDTIKTVWTFLQSLYVEKKVEMTTKVANWVLKVAKKKQKRQKMFRFSIDEHFPASSEYTLAKGEWGIQASQEQFQEQQFGDKVPDRCSDNPLKGYLWSISQRTINHFVAYGYFKKLKQNHKVNLMPLLKSVSLSSILSPETKSRRAIEISEMMKKMGHDLNKEYWTYMAFSMQELIETRLDALTILKTANNNSADILQPICRGLSMNKQPDVALRLIEPFLKNWNEVNVQKVVYPIFEAYLETDLEKCIMLIRKLDHYELKLQPLMAHSILKKIVNQELSNVDDWVSEIVAMLKKDSKLSPGMYRTLMTYYQNSDNTDRLDELEKEILDLGYDLYGMKKRLELLEAIDGDWEEADEKIKTCFKEAKYLLEYPVFDKLINVVIAEGNESRGDSGELKRFAFACGRASLYHMRNHDLKLYHTNSTFLNLLSLFAQNENPSQCLSLVKKLNRRGMGATSEHYYYLVDAYCSKGSVLLTKAVIDDMYKNNIKPSTEIYNRWIKAFLDQKTPNFSKAFEIILQMPQIKIRISDETLQLVYDKLRKTPVTTQAEKFLEVLVKVKAEPSPLPFNLCMRAYLDINKTEKVLQFYDKLLNSSCQPDAESAELLMKAYSKDKDLGMVITTFEEMKVPPNLECCYLLFSSLYQNNDFELIDKKWQEMIQKNVVDSPILDSYLVYLYKQNRFKDMVSVALDLYKERKLFPSVEMLKKIHSQLVGESKQELESYLWETPYLAKKVLDIPVLQVESDPYQIHSKFTSLLSAFKRTRVLARKRIRQTKKPL
jgi:pentatricopeptide repeat protein